MRLADTRPPFAGLANLTDEALASLPTPCYLLDEAQLRRNGEILLGVQQRTGCRILLAQKAFSNFDLYPVLAPYLAGTEASGLYESRLGREELPEKENHVFCAAYRTDEFQELLQYADHIVFNSPSQLAKFGPAAKAAGKSIGLRINPECSTQEGHEIYDPCAPGSRLGTTRAQWDAAVAAHPELLILKAFPKSYGMAGIRLGYCLCADNALLRRMAAASPPWNVSSPAQSAGVAALAERDFLQRTLSLVHTERRWLTDNLTALGFWVCPSQANYLLFRGPRGLREGLLRQGIAIRGCENYSGLDDGWYRIAVRPHEENEALITDIRQFCKEKSLWQ